MSQKDRIITHLIYGNSLTPVDALNRFGCFRLSERIRELEDQGWPIERSWYKTAGGAKVREYRLAPISRGRIDLPAGHDPFPGSSPVEPLGAEYVANGT